MPQLLRCRPVLAPVPRSARPRTRCSTHVLRPLRALLLAPAARLRASAGPAPAALARIPHAWPASASEPARSCSNAAPRAPHARPRALLSLRSTAPAHAYCPRASACSARATRAHAASRAARSCSAAARAPEPAPRLRWLPPPVALRACVRSRLPSRTRLDPLPPAAASAHCRVARSPCLGPASPHLLGACSTPPAAASRLVHACACPGPPLPVPVPARARSCAPRRAGPPPRQRRLAPARACPRHAPLRPSPPMRQPRGRARLGAAPPALRPPAARACLLVLRRKRGERGKEAWRERDGRPVKRNRKSTRIRLSRKEGQVGFSKGVYVKLENCRGLFVKQNFPLI
jgi:hypothetical protein